MKKSIRMSLLGLLFTSVGHAQQYLVEPDFYNSTAPAWTILGTATLTAEPVGQYSVGTDPQGEGWMRLSSNAQGQAGSTYLKSNFSSENGGTIEFLYATYGGSDPDADGFAIYLADGAIESPNTGGYGGRLGYTGVNGAYIGIGFDEWGYFSLRGAGQCYSSAGFICNAVPDSLVVRGRDTRQPPYVDIPYNVDPNGYAMLAQTVVQEGIPTRSRDNARKVRITLTPAPSHNFTVEIDFNDGAGYRDMFGTLSMVELNGLPPGTFRLGFSGSTGQYTNFHEVRLLGVFGAQSAQSTLESVVTSSCGPTIITARVVGSDPINNPPDGYMAFMDGETELGQVLVDENGYATLSTVLTKGSHAISAEYKGDDFYGVHRSGAQNITSGGACDPIPVPTWQEWGWALTSGILALCSFLVMRRRRRYKITSA